MAKRVKEVALYDKSKEPCSTCLYALTHSNDCDASHEPIEGKCKAYVRDEFDLY